MQVTGKWPAMYRIQGEQKSKQSFLDPNHTHFILVDNGTQRRFATEIEFRAKLEKEISQLTTSTGHGVCLCVCVWPWFVCVCVCMVCVCVAMVCVRVCVCLHLCVC